MKMKNKIQVPKKCCPKCKRPQGIEKISEIDLKCSLCSWEGVSDSLIVFSEDFKYHDHEPGID